jgi:hypothetical protein
MPDLLRSSLDQRRHHTADFRWETCRNVNKPGTTSISAACGRKTGNTCLQVTLRGMQESAMEVIWDVLVFLALVVVGLVMLNLLARRQ